MSISAMYYYCYSNNQLPTPIKAREQFSHRRILPTKAQNRIGNRSSPFDAAQVEWHRVLTERLSSAIRLAIDEILAAS
jgi:hypothetical protein